jgi:toxin ParE1/3/4
VQRFKVQLRPTAIYDFDDIFAYITTHSNAELAANYLLRIRAHCASLQYFPNRGTLISSRIKGLRYIGFERRATIFFRVQESQVDIIRILHGGQDLSPVIKEIIGKM